MYSILHISALHRIPNATISNAEPRSLLSDRNADTSDDEPIRAPDAIVVPASGEKKRLDVRCELPYIDRK